FCVICFISLANPFVKIFFGSNLTLSFATTIVIGINLYLYHIRQVVYIFKDCKGLFAENKFAPLIEALINLIVSLILVHYLGIIGVILGTIISNILVPLWNEPYILTKYYMKKSTIKYLGRILLYTTSTLISGVVTVFVCSFIPDGSIWYLILKFVVCGVVAGVSLIVTMLPFKEFKECVSWGKSIFSNFRRKDKKNSNIEINNK
ncbi:MAG: polysaccharide biosynthesis C-terminal domain-containing protein, partial [Clostridia bacterium]|nr:polysaccharide biosynthesis C-terminal domain-containing protein [Clostridia bacterium]